MKTLMLTLLYIGCLFMNFKILKLESDLKNLEPVKESLDTSIQCMLGISKMQDVNLIQAYRGEDPTLHGNYYADIPACAKIFREKCLLIDDDETKERCNYE